MEAWLTKTAAYCSIHRNQFSRSTFGLTDKVRSVSSASDTNTSPLCLSIITGRGNILPLSAGKWALQYVQLSYFSKTLILTMNSPHSSEFSNPHNALFMFRKSYSCLVSLTIHALIISDSIWCKETTVIPGPFQQQVVKNIKEKWILTIYQMKVIKHTKPTILTQHIKEKL